MDGPLNHMNSTLPTPQLTANDTNIFARYGEYGFYYHFNYDKVIIDKAFTPLLYFIGFPGNILSFLVWIRPHMRHSSGVYLSALALADLVFLSLHIFIELELAWNIPVIHYPVLCEIYPLLFLAAQYSSPLLVLCFTIERYISICHPFKREKLCTTRRALLVVVCLYSLALSLSAIQGYFWTYVNEYAECTVRTEALVGGSKSLWSIWAWCTEMLIFLVVPLLVLAFNIRVVTEARRLSRVGTVLSQGKPQKGASATTFTLLAVSFYLIVTTLPVAIVYPLYQTYHEGNLNITDAQLYEDPTWQSHLTYMTIRALISEIGITHYACNFLIYVSTGKLFRRELLKLMSPIICKKFLRNQRNSYSSMHNSMRDVTMYSTVNGSRRGTREVCNLPDADEAPKTESKL